LSDILLESRAMSTDPRTEFMQAYTPCHEPFARYCAALAYGRMDVQDLMQDVLLSAFQRFGSIRKKHELLHYLIRAARNRAVSTRRRDRLKESIGEQQCERLKDRGASAEMLVDVGILYGALDKLPSAQRDALVLFEVSGLSMAEIAEIQGSNENAVKTRVSRARITLRTRLDGRARTVRIDLLNALTSLML
jgi:RNA polymerase sigma-70 factor (ECF subfamily)